MCNELSRYRQTDRQTDRQSDRQSATQICNIIKAIKTFNYDRQNVFMNKLKQSINQSNLLVISFWYQLPYLRLNL